MSYSKTLKIMSLAALLLLLSPSNLYFGSLYLFFSLFLIFFVVKNTDYLSCKTSTIRILVSFIVNLLFAIVFLHRWGFILGDTFALITALILAVGGSYSLQGLYFSFNSNGNSIRHKDKNDLMDIILCIITSLVIILIATRSTPLIPYNDYCDANVMFTIGRGITHGKVPYRDLIDHKGPVILMIHAIGAYISSRSFTGVWLLEWVSAFFTLFMGLKIYSLFNKPDCLSRILTVPLSASLYFCFSYLYGDNAESFCVPFILFGIYAGLKAILNKRISFAQSFLVGLSISFVFWMKFTLCGAFVGMFLFMAIYMLKNKLFKNTIRITLSIVAGFITFSVPIIVYFAVNNSIEYLIQVYFVNNIFSYNLNSGYESVLTSLIMPINMLGFYMGKNYFMFILISIGLAWFSKKNSIMFGYILTSFITCFIFAFIGAKSYTYYAFILTAFAVLGWSGAISLVRYIVGSLNLRFNYLLVLLPVSLLVTISAVTECPNWEVLWLDLEDSPVYECSEIIQQQSDPTLLCYGFQDRGFYTYNDIIPDVPYFTIMNMNADITLREQDRYIRQGQYDFIITESVPHDFEGYELVFIDSNEGEGLPYFLYKRIDNGDN